MMAICGVELSRKAIMEKLGLKGRDNFEKLYLLPALAAGLISTDDHALLARAATLRAEVIRVDHFAPDLGASDLKPAGVTQRQAV